MRSQVKFGECGEREGPVNVLLVYPEFPETFWSFKYALEFIGKKASLPPLGLLTVAAMLPHEWSKRLVDVNVTRLSRRDLAWADCAFVSGMTVQRESAHSVIAQCKEAGIKVVAGGPLFTIEHEDFEAVDHFVLNEAEVTLPAFVEDLQRGCAKPVYATSEFADIRKTPTPLWSLVDLGRYTTMGIQFSRGCPYDCDFCNVTTLFGRRSRVKTVEQVLAELDALYDLGWRASVFFVDDNLVGNQRCFKEELLPALIEWRRDKIGIPFSAQVSLNMVDDEQLMRTMVEAGFGSVFIGIETPDEQSLAECGKKQNMGRDLVQDVKRIQRAGMQVQGGFIVGFDHDTPSIFQRQVDFIQKSGIVTAMVGLLQAPPGTRLYKRLKQADRLSEQMSGDNMDGTTNIIPAMNIDTLRKGYQELLGHIYSAAPYYKRVRTFLREYKLPKIQAPLKFEYVRAFIRAIFRLGVLGRHRIHFWRLLTWTFFRYPKLVPTAVTLAVYGHHFRKICDLYVL